MQKRSLLDSVDFTIAMHLIKALMSGQLSIIPSSLSSSLHGQAGGRKSVSVESSGGSSSYIPSVFHVLVIQVQT
jgi:hypothetical protein